MANSFDKSRAWRQMLKDVGDNLDRRNVHSIIFLLVIPDGVAQALKHDGCKTLQKLEERGNINIHRPDELIELLKEIRRFDLKCKVEKFKRQCAQAEIESKQEKNFVLKKPGDFTLPDASPGNVIPVQSTSLLEMKASPRGICLIISNEKFDPLFGENDTVNGPQEHSSESDPEDMRNVTVKEDSCLQEVDSKPVQKDKLKADSSEYDRPWTCADEESLDKTFTWLGFEIIKKRNLTKDQIHHELKDVAEMDHLCFDAFVCCILTHGNDENVYGTDWRPLKLVDIRHKFKGNVCRSLISKPKIFLVQAYSRECEEPISSIDEDGNQLHKSLKEKKVCSSEASTDFLVEDTSSNAETNPKSAGESWDTSMGHEKDRFDEFPGQEQAAMPSPPTQPIIVPSDSNFLSFISTTSEIEPGDGQGSLFISTICKVFQEFASTEPIRDMLQHAGDKIYKATESTPIRLDTLDVEKIFFGEPPVSWEMFVKQQTN